jgi:NADH-quinone oxidoreductase subunit N
MAPSLFQCEIAVGILLLGLLLADLFLAVDKRKLFGGATILLAAILGWSLAGASALPEISWTETARSFFVLDRLALWGKQFALLATLIAMILALRFFGREEKLLVEHGLLQLTACLGMMLVVSANHLTVLFISLELMTVSFYTLVGFRRRDPLSLEAAIKYLIYGAFSSGILLYGISLVYGATGHLDFAGIAASIRSPGAGFLLGTGLLMMLAGLGFKISATPFHWWTPDVYEGAPTPTTAYLATASKGIGFIILIRLLNGAFQGLQGFWLPIICLLSAASILWGNLGGLSQSNFKRLMGYSSISHTGYMLLGVAAAANVGLPAVLYYLLGYLLANALVFGVMIETATDNPRQEIRSSAGLGRRSAWLAAALVMGLLSLSGIPPLAGFFGKLLIFRAAWESSLTGLLAVALFGAVASLFYYLGILRVMYFGKATATDPLTVGRGMRWVFLLLIVGVFVVGFYPEPWWEWSRAAAGTLFR